MNDMRMQHVKRGMYFCCVFVMMFVCVCIFFLFLNGCKSCTMQGNELYHNSMTIMACIHVCIKSKNEYPSRSSF